MPTPKKKKVQDGDLIHITWGYDRDAFPPHDIGIGLVIRANMRWETAGSDWANGHKVLLGDKVQYFASHSCKFEVVSRQESK